MQLLHISLFETKFNSFFISIHIHQKLKEKHKLKHYDIIDIFTELFRVCLQSAILADIAVRVLVSALT